VILAYTALRALSWLKRLALATESLARSSSLLASIESERHARESAAPRRPRAVEFGSLDVAEAERRWRADREASAEGVREAIEELEGR